VQLLLELGEAFAASDFAGKFIIGFILAVCADFLDGAAESGILSGHVLDGVHHGESNLNLNLLAGGLADQLIFETGDEIAAAKGEGIVLGVTAFKGFAVAVTGEIDDDFIALLAGTVGGDNCLLILIDQTVDLAVNLIFGYGHVLKNGFKSLII
jgi:hypothetical protein